MYTVENTRVILNRVLFGLAFVAKMTPNKIDDGLVTVISTLVTNDSIMELLVAFLNSTHKEGEPVKAERVVGAFMEHFA